MFLMDGYLGKTFVEFAKPNTNFKVADECYAVLKFASQFKLHLMVCKVTKCGSADLMEDHYALGFSNGTLWFIMDVSLGKTFVMRPLEKRGTSITETTRTSSP